MDAQKGTVAFDGSLHLDSQLAINERIRSQLFRPIRGNFQPINEPGYSAIGFQVGGTVDRPRTNLMDRLVGRDISTMLNTLFGRNKEQVKRKKKKPVEEEPALAPSPTGSPEEAPAQATVTATPAALP